MKRILVADNESAVLDKLQRALTSEGFEVTTVTNGQDALRLLSPSFPDLFLLDSFLPDQDGLALCQSIREQGHIFLPIVFLSARDRISDKVAGLNAGADDYLTKPFHLRELLAHLRAALRWKEEYAHSPANIRVGDLFLDAQRRQIWRGARCLNLTKKEYDLLALFIQNAGQILPRQRIFERIWGYETDTGPEVVKVYITYLRSKLNEKGEADLIQAIRGLGYLLKLE